MNQPAVQRLGELLQAERRRTFVGRTEERALFQSALASPRLPFHVLFIHGPGGVGKTSLLRELAAICEVQGLRPIALDGRELQPTAESVGGALQRAAEALPAARRTRRTVLLIDAFEALAPIEAWFREVSFPQLPEDTLIVLAGRHPPSVAWRTDPGWRNLLHALPLRNLDRAESEAYLQLREVPRELHAEILAFTHGHPLALALSADLSLQRPGAQFQPETAPDLVRALLERLVDKAPSAAHRAALEACAVVRLTTEPLLAAMLELPDVHDIFSWLRGLSFMESDRGGIYPHELAGEALIADLRWRNPEQYRKLYRRARAYYVARMTEAGGLITEQPLADFLYLHHDHPAWRQFQSLYRGQQGGGLAIDQARAADLPGLIEMVRHHEGDESARIAAHWSARQPRGIVVVRDSGGACLGFLAHIALRQVAPEDLDLDPGVRSVWQYLPAAAPLRPGEEATFIRFWMARDTYQRTSPVQGLVFVAMTRSVFSTAGLAHSFVAFADAEFWAPLTEMGEARRLTTADFEVGGRRYGVVGRDWRGLSPLAWLQRQFEHQEPELPGIATMPGATVGVALAREAFAGALRDALRDLTRPEALRRNPLLRAQLVVQRAGEEAGAAARIEALQTAIGQAVDSLRSSPRREKYYRALFHTYLKPATSQEKAAELLDLPFSTFRSHLQAGTGLVTEILWQEESGYANDVP